MPKPVATNIDRHLGARLRKLRRRKGVSASDLAEAIGSSQQQVSRYENGENKLAAAQLYRIAQSLDTPIGWFFQGADGLEPPPLRVADNPGAYQVPRREQAAIEEELTLLQTLWPRLSEPQRNTLLRLLDTLEAPQTGGRG